uniref:zinc-ribbon domain-containing protein n=1 Tax=Anaeromyxobacter terrae TaxID=2925406 RepID=UPI001F59C8C5
MIVLCTSCQAKFRVADEKIGPRGAKVRCSRCQTVFSVHRELGATSLPAALRSVPAASPAPRPRRAPALDVELEPPARSTAPPPGDPFAFASPPEPPPARPDPFAATFDPFAPAPPSAPEPDPFAWTVPAPSAPDPLEAGAPRDPFQSADPFGPSIAIDDPFGAPGAARAPPPVAPRP